jgi:hypothetical protein
LSRNECGVCRNPEESESDCKLTVGSTRRTALCDLAAISSDDGTVAACLVDGGLLRECIAARTWAYSAGKQLPVAMLALAGPAHSAGAESTPNQLAPGQALAIADLEGVKIKLVTEMLMQREGGPQFPVTQDTDWNITVEPEARSAGVSSRPLTPRAVTE